MVLACPVWPPDTRLYSDRRLAAGSRTSSTLALYADLVTCYLVTRVQFPPIVDRHRVRGPHSWVFTTRTLSPSLASPGNPFFLIISMLMLFYL